MHDWDSQFPWFFYTVCWEEGKPYPVLRRTGVADIPVGTALHLFTSVTIFSGSLLWWYRGGSSAFWTVCAFEVGKHLDCNDSPCYSFTEPRVGGHLQDR